MNAALTHLPALQTVLPLFGAVAVAFLRKPAAAFVVTSAVVWLLPVISLMLLWQVCEAGPISYALGGWAPPWGIEYRIDLLNGLMLSLVSLIAAAAMPYARASIGREIEADRQAWFYSLYLLCLTGLLGVTVTGDAFNAFVFLEISSLSAYTLIALGSDRRALHAAFQYLILGTIGATFYVIGVGFLYLLTGSLNMADIAERLAEVPPEQARVVAVALAFITVGIGLKLALFPLHFWLPNAYAYAPSFVSLILAATATKVAVYLLIRYYFTVFGMATNLAVLPLSEALALLSLAAMFIASLVAVFQTNVKRMFAYSSLAQIGYIVLGIALANHNGLTGSLTHIINHAVIKAAIFASLGAVFLCVGTVHLPKLAGLGRKMPLTMGAFTLAGLALIGVPGTAGFISKWYLALGVLDTGWNAVVGLLLLSSLISVVYVGRVVEIVWFRPLSTAAQEAREPPSSMLIPILIFAGLCLYLGIDTRWSAGLAQEVAQMLLGGVR